MSEALTLRELEIARLVSQGWRDRAIAQHLRIAESTVRAHVDSIKEKWGLDATLNIRVQIAQKLSA